MSATGIPVIGTNEVRRRAAVALYDEAPQIASEELLDNLYTLQDGFRDGTPIPEAVGESVLDYAVRSLALATWLLELTCTGARD